MERLRPLLALALAQPDPLSAERWRAVAAPLVAVLGSVDAPADCGLAEAMGVAGLLRPMAADPMAATALAHEGAHEVTTPPPPLTLVACRVRACV